MKSLVESLFDSDLVKKDIGVLDVIVACLTNYIKKGKTQIKEWVDCLNNIEKATGYKNRGGWDLLRNDIPNKCKGNELYMSISYRHDIPTLFLMTRGLIGDKEFSTEACPLVVLRYSSELETIYADVYRTGVGTYDYKDIINSNKGTFQWYKIDPKETREFVDNVFNKIDQVF